MSCDVVYFEFTDNELYMLLSSMIYIFCFLKFLCVFLPLFINFPSTKLVS